MACQARELQACSLGRVRLPGASVWGLQRVGRGASVARWLARVRPRSVSDHVVLCLSPVDINECLSLSAACPIGHTCINTEGSYTCQKNVPNCGRGYHLNEEGTHCVGGY